MRGWGCALSSPRPRPKGSDTPLAAQTPVAKPPRGSGSLPQGLAPHRCSLRQGLSTRARQAAESSPVLPPLPLLIAWMAWAVVVCQCLLLLRPLLLPCLPLHPKPLGQGQGGLPQLLLQPCCCGCCLPILQHHLGV